MDIHKPRPWHGLREFLKEYVIIVVGVLTALGAEAVVEGLHWRHRVEASEATLRRDLTLVADFATERVAMGRCLDDRLDTIRDAVLHSGERWDTVLPAETDGVRYEGFVYFPPSRVWITHAWENIGADGTLGHFDPERARNFALLYSRISSASAMTQREDDVGRELQVLSSRSVPLGPDGRLGLLQAIDRAKMTNGQVKNISRQILRQIQDAGYLPSVAESQARLTANAPNNMRCRFVDEALKDRVARNFYTLGR